ncbi:MAG: prolyl oligopeptidase family serine peptidase [Bacteroidales bacterium]|nr:prolyl oligopeptidase family serine peptidase [Bacteroidales bacterium]
MKRFIILALALLSGALVLSAQDGYDKKSFTSSSGTVLLYRSLDPINAKAGKKYPLVIFMHGAGERGTDNELQLVHGSGMFLNPSNRDHYPSYVIFPQCPPEGFWSYDSSVLRGNDFGKILPPDPPLTKETQAVRELIDQYVSSGKVDPKRIYIMGLSMGGMATFDMVLRYPDLFAAAIPICGAVNIDRITEKPSTKFWIFHGDVDTAVLVQGSRDAYRKLTSLGAKVEYTEFPGVNHGCWNDAFATPGFFKWLFHQHR